MNALEIFCHQIALVAYLSFKKEDFVQLSEAFATDLLAGNDFAPRHLNVEQIFQLLGDGHVALGRRERVGAVDVVECGGPNLFSQPATGQADESQCPTEKRIFY